MASVIESGSNVVLGDKERADALIDIGSGFPRQDLIEKAECRETGCTVVFESGSQGELMGNGSEMKPFLENSCGQKATIVQARFGTDIFSLEVKRPENTPIAAD